MVARMKKFMFLAYHKDYRQFLDDLGNLGLIHVAESKQAAEDNEDMYRLLSQSKLLREAKTTLERLIDKKEEIAFNTPNADVGKLLPQKIEEIEDARATLVQQLQVSVKERESLLPWGQFDPEQIAKLEDAGWKVNFFVVSDNQYNTEWEILHDAVVINKETSKTYFVTVGKNANVANEMNLEPIKLPEISIAQLDELIASLKIKIAEEDTKLKALVADLPSIDEAIADYEQNIT